MEDNAEPKEIAGVPAAKPTVPEQLASNNSESQRVDAATSGESGVTPSFVKAAENTDNASETNSSKDQKVADWNRFAENLVGAQSRKGRMAASQNQKTLATAGTVNWKAYALKAEKTVRGLRVELNQEKDNSNKIKTELDSALKENDDLTEKLSEAIEELSQLDPESRRIQQQAVKDLEAKVVALEAEIRGLRRGTVAPEGQASGSKSEPRAIQQLDDNMGIDSDEEVDEFETDDESNVRLN